MDMNNTDQINYKDKNQNNENVKAEKDISNKANKESEQSEENKIYEEISDPKEIDILDMEKVNSNESIEDSNAKFEKIFNSKKGLKEKERDIVFYLLGQLDEDEENCEKSNQKKEIFVLIEKYFPELLKIFEERGQGYRVTIKILQVLDIIFDDIENVETDQDYSSYKDAFSAVISKIGPEPDRRILRKINEMSFEEKLTTGFMSRLKIIKNALLWKEEKIKFKLVESILDELKNKYVEDPVGFTNCLIKGRFDKMNSSGGSLIIGDEGGLFLLINSAAENSLEEAIIFESGVTPEFLNEKRKEDNKIILGKGNFGKVGLALSIFGDTKVDIGQLICVKKSCNKSGVKKTLKDTTVAVYEDFMAKKVNSSIYVPMPLDMAIIKSKKNDEKFSKSYFFLEIIPQTTAKKTFSNPEYQKWEFQKPYCLDVMKSMIELLENDQILNTDLKPDNTLFDVISRKMFIIDLGSSVFIDKKEDLKEFDLNVLEFGCTIKYCPPEFLDEIQREKLKPKCAIAYLCGKTIEEITENNDLNIEEKEELESLLNEILNENPDCRLDIEIAMDKLKKIRPDEDAMVAAFTHYIDKVKSVIETDPVALNLNSDILAIKKKGIIDQFVTKNNPHIYKDQVTEGLLTTYDNFLDPKNPDNQVTVMLILGEAGSGKSLSLQMLFINEVQNWTPEKPLPIFFNMANEINLDDVIRSLNGKLSSNLQLNKLDNKKKIHLFVDSFDEGCWDDKMKEENLAPEKIIEQYKSKLQEGSKIVITCRTDFTEINRGEILLKQSTQVNYITSIGYGNESNFNTKFEKLVSEWLGRWDESKKYQSNLQQIALKIGKSGLRKKMSTGLMFNMIMGMIIKMNEEELKKHERIPSFEIYDKAIFQEILQNWVEIVDKKNIAKKEEKTSDIKESDVKVEKNLDEKLDLLIQEIALLFEENEYPNINDLETKKKFIFEGMLRIGELIAARMSITKRNRLNIEEVNNLIFRKFYENSPIEWNTLYKIVQIMGLKLERRKFGDETEINNNILDVGFRHETYKNYFLLRGLKRALKIRKPNTSKQYYQFNESLINAVIDQKINLTNYELIKFCGEQVKFEKVDSFKKDLLSIIKEEQNREIRIKKRLKTIKQKNEPIEKDKSNLTPDRVRASIVMSILVAGEHKFTNGNLSNLDLTGAYLRGGDFFQAEFNNTCLSKANLRNANIDQAKFINCDLRGLDLGIRPDLIGHKNEVKSLAFSPDGKYLASGSDDKSIRIWDAVNGKCLKIIGGDKEPVCRMVSSYERKYIAQAYYDNTIKIWDEANLNYLNALEGHEGLVKCLAFSQDERLLVSGSEDKSSKIWEIESGTCLHTLDEHDDIVNSVTFSLDGKFMISGGGDNTVKIWDVTSGDCLKTLKGHKGSVLSAAISTDMKLLVSGSEDKTVKIWDAESGACLRTLEGHSNSVRSVEFNRDGDLLVSGGEDKVVRIWNVANGACLKTIGDDGDSLSSMILIQDRKYIAKGYKDSKIKIWDSDNGNFVQVFEGHKGSISSLALSCDGKFLFSGSEDKTVKIWDTLGGKCLLTLEGHNGPVRGIALSSNSELVVSGSDDKTIRIWNAKSGVCLKIIGDDGDELIIMAFSLDKKYVAKGYRDKRIMISKTEVSDYLKILEGHKGPVRSLYFSENGKLLVSGSEDKTIKIWDFENSVCLRTIGDDGDEMSSMAFSLNTKYIAKAYKDNKIKIWRTEDGVHVKTLEGKKGRVKSLSFSKDGKFLISGDDNRITVWNAENGDCVREITVDKEKVWRGAISCDGKSLAEAYYSSTKVKIWDVKNGACLHILDDHIGNVNCIQFSPDGKFLASGSCDCTVKIWDVTSGVCLQTIEVGNPVIDVAFSPDLKLLAILNIKNKVMIWESRDAVWKCCKFECGNVKSMALSPDGKFFVNGDYNRNVNIWDVQSGICLKILGGHNGLVRSVAFSPDGMILISGSEDYTVKIWDVKSGDCLQTLKAHNNWVMSVAFSPDGMFLVSGSIDTLVKVWDFSSGACLKTLEGHNKMWKK